MDPKALRIVFMGTPDFAVSSLQALVEGGFCIVGVVTSVDKPAGRGQHISMSAVKKYALKQGLKILQPTNLKSEGFIAELSSLNADLQVVVAFRMLPEKVWNMPPLGTFNLHASLLPKYRGAAPLNWAIIRGETISGVTTFKLTHEIDTGNIIFQEKAEIGPDDNVEVLHDKLMVIGARLVTKTVEALAAGNVEFVSQSELIRQGVEPTPAPKIFKNDCRINWNKPMEQVKNFVRGLSPYPAAWTELVDDSGKTISMKIYALDLYPQSGTKAPGEIISDKKHTFIIGTANGAVQVTELQLSGKKRMKTEDFLRGFQQIDNYKAV
jgi:methionyl-tRNA formyltransferase